MTTISQPKSSTAERLLARSYTLDWETLTYGAIFVLAVLSRFIDLGVGAMSHDESLHTKYSWNLYRDASFGHTPMMHGPLLFHMTALSYYLFGDNDFTGRLYPALIGVLLVLVPVLYRRWIGRTAALIASVLLLISPYILYYSRYIRHDIPVIFFALLMIWAAFSYVEDEARRPRWLYAIAVFMILMLASKEVAFMYIAIVGLFLTLFWLTQLLRRWVDSRIVFHIVIAGILLGGIISIGLIVAYTILQPTSWTAKLIPTWEEATYARRGALWTLLVIVPVGLVFLGTGLAYAVARRRKGLPVDAGKLSKTLLAVLVVTALVTGLFVFLEQVTYIDSLGAEVAEPATPEEPGAVAVEPDAGDMLVKYGPLMFADLFILLIGGGLIVFARMRGWWKPLMMPVFDVLIIMGTLILPWLTAFAIYVQGDNPTDYSNGWVMVLNLIPFIGISIIVGLTWDWRWVIAAGLFYAIFVFFFTSMFTNGQGVFSGMVGSLGYWLEQQGERRGSQPQYYYVLQVIFYEFLPLVGALCAGLLGLVRFYRGLFAEVQTVDDEALAIETQTDMPVVMFFGYLTVLNFLFYTFAGEKMPWLTTHLTVPMIFLTAWFVAQVLLGLRWDALRGRGWLLVFVLPLAVLAGGRLVMPAFDRSQSPFGGDTLRHLYLTGEWLVALAVFAGCVAVVVYVLDRTGARFVLRVALGLGFVFLAYATGRSAWMATYIHYDSPVEYMFYAHAAPATKRILHLIEDLSQHTTEGRDLIFAYDNINSWPMSWYFRDFPNARFYGENPSMQLLDDAKVVLSGYENLGKVEPLLQDRYYRFDYNRMVWPMQDYFGVEMEQVDRLFAPTAEGAQLRQGLFDIWWGRDYSTYARATGRSPEAFSLPKWPVAQKTAVFVRKDIAALTWPYGVGETAQLDIELEENPYKENVFTLTAADALGSDAGLTSPRGLALGPEGNLYVADTGGGRVVVFAPDGTQQMTIGQPNPPSLAEGQVSDPGFFNQPWGIAVAEDGTIFVADTWNHRVQVFTPEGEFVTTWGHFGQDGDSYAFYGPRNVAVDGETVYVVDTGNKRIRAYDLEGNFLRDIGSGGSAPGQLSEPVGLTIDKTGSLIVADTWNRRVQVFDPLGNPLLSWWVEAWHGLAGEFRTGNLPFIAYDDRGNVYVPDPDTCRILVFDKTGDYRYNFGQCVSQAVTLSAFQVLGGLVIGEDYQLYVADADANRILRFDLSQEPALEE